MTARRGPGAPRSPRTAGSPGRRSASVLTRARRRAGTRPRGSQRRAAGGAPAPRTPPPARTARLAPALLGQEHPHAVLVVACHSRPASAGGRRTRRAIALEAHVEHAAARVPFSSSIGPLRRHLALVAARSTWSQTHSTSGSRCEDRMRLMPSPWRDVVDEVQHLLAALRVEAVRRLVEEQQVRVVHERLGELDALLHARRVGLDVAVARLAEAHVVEHLVGALIASSRGRPESCPRRPRTPTAFMPGMWRPARACSRAARAPRAGAVATSRPNAVMRPAVGRQEAEQRLEQRGLARAVRAEQAHRAGRERRR